MASPRPTEPIFQPIKRQEARNGLPSNILDGEVREQLERILISPIFRNSKRNCSLLKHVVERTLEGHQDDLKERAIGVDVFGRSIDYDTNADHIVRSVAGEVRRRLAQYYMEPERDGEIRIDLLSGSYVSQFRLPPRRLISSVVVAPVGLPAPAIAARPVPRWRSWPAIWAAIVAIAACLSVWWLASPKSALEKFWSPFFSSPNTALLCVGGGAQANAAAATDPMMTVLDFERQPSRRMHISDATALAEIAGLLQSKGKPYRILNRASATSFKDLQSGPFILIGGMNNEWTLRLTAGLRFSFERAPNSGGRVVDNQNPSSNAWAVDYAAPMAQLNRDYAIISRVRDPKTEQTAVVVAGIGSWGTQAAAEFVTNPEHLKKLEARAPRHWEGKNLQIVIATDVIRGSSGPPTVLAAYFW